MCVTPAGRNASRIAFIKIGNAPVVPASPAPFTPNGLVGLGLGCLAAWGLTSAFQLPFVLSPMTAFWAITFSGLVGIVFGSYPAWQAARLDPIEALRRE